MSIDWSKAPEGATHYQPESRDFHAAWFRLQGGKAREMWVVIPGGALEHIIDPTAFDESMQNLIARPAEPATWNGKGLPPVGTVCEVKHRDIGWVRCEIVAHKSFSCGGLTHAIAWIDENTLDQSQGLRFRQLRTPEQIAAEEREKAVGDMAMSIQGVPYQYPTLYALFDAGYRRQEEGK
ncbi:hypothetical protein ACUHM0_005244 [Pseudomonas aeruginosa]|nr:hypothetical protein [Pseudomonas aeruginosa]HEJ9831234.1 hypothetical protein [Pseudomonas aeruginosa]HEK1278401.1 hypothetical protein [Pseudomonas aeruginosa]HEP9291442.1 hypothetical protein [Pseudomonas aeruginosa]